MRLRDKKLSTLKWARKTCSKKTLRNRLPLLKWIPSYNLSMAGKDAIAGVTVGATMVAQGIAYANIAGLPTEYGLYSGVLGGFIYFFFGNCENMSIGPTAIISALVAKYVKGLSPDFAVLLAFLAGLTQLLLAVLRLSFLVEFLSAPVTTGFTAAAAIQICASQLKSFFGLEGKSGNSFVESVYKAAQNITTINYYDTLLGIVTVLILISLKHVGQITNTIKNPVYRKVLQMLNLSRNVVVIIIGILLSYAAHACSLQPFTIVGDIRSGMPDIELPPFSTTIGNETVYFGEMLQVLGFKSLVIPFVGIMEVVIIYKAFTPDTKLDATQEIIALGLTNLGSAFLGGMPVTGAFSRSALNNASGAQTPAAGILVCLIMLLSLSFLTPVFQLIPKASLAGMLIVSVLVLVHVDEIKRLWRQSKKEFAVLIIVMLAGLTLGLEFGVIIGVALDIIIILYKTARPAVTVNSAYIVGREVVLITLPDHVSYCSAEFIRKTIVTNTRRSNGPVVIIDGRNTQTIDTTVISNIVSMLNTIDYNNCKVAFMNFTPDLKEMFSETDRKHEDKFVCESAVDKLLDDRF